MSLDLRHLRVVLALDRYGTFQQAARALGVSQPALSRSLQALERDIGARLFDRGGPGGVVPTELGRILLERGPSLIQEHRELLREVRLTQGLELGQFTVSAAFFPASVSVHRAVGYLVREHPGIEVHVNVGHWRICTDEVLARAADVAVADLSMAAQHPQLDVESVGRHRFVFVCRSGHPLLEAGDVTPEGLFSFPWSATRAPAAMVKHFPEPPFAAGRIEPATGEFVPAVLAADLGSSHEVVRESDAIGVAVSPAATGRPLPRGMVELPFQAPWTRLDYGFITLKGRTASPAAEAFMRMVREIESELPARTGKQG